jgi:hypothetical protein
MLKQRWRPAATANMGLNPPMMSGARIAAPLPSGALLDRGLYNTRAVAIGCHRHLRRDHDRRRARATPHGGRKAGQASRPCRAELKFEIPFESHPFATSHRPRLPIAPVNMKPLQIRRAD